MLVRIKTPSAEWEEVFTACTSGAKTDEDKADARAVMYRAAEIPGVFSVVRTHPHEWAISADSG